LFGFARVLVVHAVRVRKPTTLRRGVALTAFLIVVLIPSPAHAAPTVCVETVLQPPGVAALRPSDVRLGIIQPRAGETMLEVDSSESITVSVDYWGPRLVPPDVAHAVDDLHLVYILDADASPYIGTTQPMLVCDKHIAHSTGTHITFDNVAHGSHTLAVLLAGSNNVSVNPPVAASVTFTVK
jgi:hypothetical protein